MAEQPLPEPEKPPTSGAMLTFIGLLLLTIGLGVLAFLSSIIVKYKFEFWDVLFTLLAIAVASYIYGMWRGGDKPK